MRDPLVDKIQTKIEIILSRAIVVACDEGIGNPGCTYDDTRFIYLVIEPLLELAFFDNNDDLKNQISSPNEYLKNFIYLILEGLKTTCYNCGKGFRCHLCHELQKGTSTQSKVPRKEGAVCNSNFLDFMKNYLEQNSTNFETSPGHKQIPPIFVNRLKIIIQSLFEYLDLICYQDQELEEKIEESIFMKADAEKIYVCYEHRTNTLARERKRLFSNARKYCVVLFESRAEDPQHIDRILSNSNIILPNSSLFLNSECCGYLCIKSRLNKNNSDALCSEINRFIRTHLQESGILCRVIKKSTLFLIQLACPLMRFINIIYLSTPELRYIVPEILFKQTNLAYNLFFNMGLYMGFRQHGYKILFCMLFHYDEGAQLFGQYYLSVFSDLLASMLKENNIRNYIHDITRKFIDSPNLLVYLVENGFLTRVIDFISLVLTNICFHRTLEFGMDRTFCNLCQRELFYFYDTIKTLKCVFLCPESMNIPSENLKNEVRKAGHRLIQMCDAFDNIPIMQLSKIVTLNFLNYNQFCQFIKKLYITVCHYFSWVVFFKDTACEIIGIFFTTLKNNQLDPTLYTPTGGLIYKLLHMRTVEHNPFLVYNLSQRLFYDVWTRCTANNVISLSFKNLTYEDLPYLIGICQAAMVTLSLEMGYVRNINKEVEYSWRYSQPEAFSHIFIQDFSAIQCLMSILDPDTFLKYLILNFFSEKAAKASIITPLALVVSMVSFTDNQLQKFLVFLYNVLTERHFVGKLMNPAAYFLERRIIHFLAIKERTPSEMKKFIKSCCLTCETLNNGSDSASVNEILNRISYNTNMDDNGNRYALVHLYYSLVNPFYFLNDSINMQELHENLYSFQSENKYIFQIHPIVDVQDHFQKMNDFVFSQVFLDLILTAFNRWCVCPLETRRSLDQLLMIVMMCLCLILTASRDPTIYYQYGKLITFIFGLDPFKSQGILKILISQYHTITNPIAQSIVNHFIFLSKN
ncbi:hypothetical protein RF11_00510 [Thelohanellus kitauei]|uniref:E3 ubiquitin-protein ligase n=1 Tax=Thelohanellus kitauei TaxID=669202 RepID=A0A0C2JRS2_THEKT|nr:hypothetical protein RF11_00510 [Thelohanellus kitauei]